MLFVNVLISALWSVANTVPAAAPVLHDYKMSVCEIVCSPQNTVAVKFYLFTDDLTATITGNPQNALPAGQLVGEYILKHFRMSVNGSAQNLSFQSIRQKNDQVLVEFGGPDMAGKSISTVQVKNDLLLEKYKDQVNMVYAIFPEKSKQVRMLDAGNREGAFTF